MELLELGSVQKKIPCVFEITVLQEPSEKRSFQTYKVIANDNIRLKAEDSDVFSARPSEKLDGTCVWISSFQGFTYIDSKVKGTLAAEIQNTVYIKDSGRFSLVIPDRRSKPWLWARHDRKPTKSAEKKFRAHQNKNKSGTGDCSETYVWDVSKDFKDVPENWVPATGLEIRDGVVQPDSNGHIPGWVPVSPTNRQHCWHMSTVQLENNLALILREDVDGDLEIASMSLSDLDGHTAELIGTNINGNAYKIGTKQCPIHLLVVHGSISLQNSPSVDHKAISHWLQNNPGGNVEGIVWHCHNQALFKLHRHHLGLKWPIDNPLLSQRSVKITVDHTERQCDANTTTDSKQKRDLFLLFAELKETVCDSLSKLHKLLD